LYAVEVSATMTEVEIGDATVLGRVQRKTCRILRQSPELRLVGVFVALR
jgi:hypothetical protein